MLASEETRCRGSEPHIAHDSTKLFRAFSWLFLSVSYLQKGKASWAMCFHLMSVDYKKALPLFPTPLVKMSLRASARRQMAAVLPEEFLSWNVQKPANLLNTIFLIWHIGQVLAPEGKFVHLCASDGTETLLSYCQSPAEREPRWPAGGKKCYFYHSDSSECYRQDRFCSVDVQVCDWNRLSWCGSLRMQRASVESWQLHRAIFEIVHWIHQQQNVVQIYICSLKKK